MFAAGGFADVHEAELDGQKVCIKALRSYSQDTSGVVNKVRLLPRSFAGNAAEVPGLVDIL